MLLEKLQKEKVENILSNTPCYLMSEQRLIESIYIIRDLCGENIKICYSVKSNPWMTTCAKNYVDQVEVCSDGELSICKAAGVDCSTIIAGGIYKDKKYLTHIIESEIGIISLESKKQVEMLQKQFVQNKVQCRCLLRLSSGNQFGFSNTEIVDILKEKEKYPNLLFAGIHYYSGTQKKRPEDILQEMEAIEREINRIQNLFTTKNIILEYGPGIGFPYFNKEKEQTHFEILNVISNFLKKWAKKYELILEFGRICTAEAGEYITKIVDIKENGGRKYYILDGGHHHVNYYGEAAGFRIPYFSVIQNKQKFKQKEKVTVCGSLCTSSDIMMRDVEIETCGIGDYIVFCNTGAYSSTESRALFLSREYPNIFIVDKKNRVHLIVRKQRLLSEEQIYGWNS